MTPSWQQRIFFGVLTQRFEALFYYSFQEGPKIKLPNIKIIQSKYGISIDQTDHIMKNIIQEYWGTNKKYEVTFQLSPFTVDTSFKNTLFVDTPLIVDGLKQIEKSHGG